MSVQEPFKLFAPLEYSLDQCIKCNICTSACPVSAATDLFPGPKYAGPQAGRFRLLPLDASPDISVDYCSGCRVCNLVCPNGVKIAEMNARARARMVVQGRISKRLWLRNNLIARAELIGKISQPVSPFANALLGSPAARQFAEKALAIAHDAPLPRLASQRFSAWFNKREKKTSEKKVAYFHGCSSEYYEPRVAIAAVQVLESCGFEVILPHQNCCGLPLLSNGEFEAARRCHTRNVSNLIEYARQGIPIVGTSPSCTLTLKEEAPELLDMQDEDTLLVASQTFDINEFLVNLYAIGGFNLELQPIHCHLPYHISCQYRAHRLGSPGLAVLGWIPELQIEQSRADCCGIAGTYGYKTEKYEISLQVGRPLFDFVRKFGASLAICDSETCRWQISHATGIPAVHPVELLSAAIGFPLEGILSRIIQGNKY